MQITLKLYAMLTDYLPEQAVRNEASLELSEGSSVAEIVQQLKLPKNLVHLTLVNGSYIAPEQFAETVLNDGDVLAIWPPVAGG